MMIFEGGRDLDSGPVFEGPPVWLVVLLGVTAWIVVTLAAIGVFTAARWIIG